MNANTDLKFFEVLSISFILPSFGRPQCYYQNKHKCSTDITYRKGVYEMFLYSLHVDK